MTFYMKNSCLIIAFMAYAILSNLLMYFQLNRNRVYSSLIVGLYGIIGGFLIATTNFSLGLSIFVVISFVFLVLLVA